MLRGLKMYGMAQAVSDLVEQAAPAFEAAVPTLSQLLKAEMAEREVRSIAYQTKSARFPAYKDLASFDFAASETNEATLRQLHRGEFTERADNVVLIGGPGTGKTHLATALGIQAIEHGRKKVRFFPTVDLVNALEQERTANKAGQLADRLLRLDLVILDELGYLPATPSSSGCRSVHRVAPCCSTCSASFTSGPAWSSPPT
jgi:DNA replication protein DnaC